MSQNGTLTRKQEKALEFILSSKSIVQASEMSGVSRRQLHRWLSLPEFKLRLQTERARVRSESIDVLRDLFSRSITKLSSLLDNEDARIQLKTCELVLRYNLEVIELEGIDSRLRALEDARDGKTPLNNREKFEEVLSELNHHLGIIPNGE